MLLQLIVGGTAGLAVFGRYLWQSLTERIHMRRHPVQPKQVTL